MKYEIKQTDDYAVVISDEEIKEENYCYRESNSMFFLALFTKEHSEHFKGCKKVIATIGKQIEGLPMLELPNQREQALTWWNNLIGKEARDLFKKYHPTVLSVSKATTEEIEKIYLAELPNQEEDVEKLGRDRAIERRWNPDSMETRRVANEIIEAVKYGYKAAQSKKYSEEDMRKAFNAGDSYRYYQNNGSRSIPSDVLDEDDFIQSLQKKQFPIAVDLDNNMNSLKWYYE